MTSFGTLKSVASLVLIATACGRYETNPVANAGNGGTATNTGVGGSSSKAQGGSAPLGGSAALGGEAGSANDECFSTPAMADTDFAAPSVVQQRLSAVFLERPSVAELPANTSVAWAAELATSFVVDLPTPNPAFTHLFAGWFSGPALRTQPSAAFATEIGERAQVWGQRWALQLAASWDMRQVLLTPARQSLGAKSTLTDADLLSLYNSISWRGFWVASNLLCSAVSPEPQPPPSAKPMTRADVMNASASASCQGCHRYFEPAGFAFDQYDATGTYRDLPLDVSGKFVTPNGDDLAFADMDDLAAQLTSSCEVARCIASTFLTQSLERAGISAKPTDAEINRVANQFAQSEFSALELVRAVATSPSMLR